MLCTTKVPVTFDKVRMDRAVPSKQPQDSRPNPGGAVPQADVPQDAPRFSELDREHGDEAEQAKRIADQEQAT